MATFPKSEADTLLLAQEMKTGLANNTTMYPAPPVTPTAIETLMAALETAQNAVVEARGIAEQATANRVAALETLVAAMKRDLRYAEGTVNYDDVKLKMIGWSGRKPAESLTAPGQTLELTVVEQGEGWLTMQWKKPIDGGALANYMIYRRPRPEGAWELVKPFYETSITLTGQTRATEWEYKVSAANKAGEGLASNTVLAVL